MIIVYNNTQKEYFFTQGARSNHIYYLIMGKFRCRIVFLIFADEEEEMKSRSPVIPYF